MTPSDRQSILSVYKTFLDQDKSSLLEMPRRYAEFAENLPDAMDTISGDPYVQLDHYLRQVRTALNACEAVRQAIEKRLSEME